MKIQNKFLIFIIMESKRSNLFISDKSFRQNWTLSFIEPGTEKRFTAENFRFHFQSLKYIEFWNSIILCIVYLSGQINLLSAAGILILVILQKFVENSLLKRFTFLGICVTWQSIFFNEGTITECFGIFFPSFIVNLLILPSFIHSLFFFLLEGLYLYTLNPLSAVNLSLSILTYTIILSCIEKDFRDIWHMYSSFKKSNSLNKALWDNFPGAELLVGNDGKIIYYNKCSLKLMKKLRRPEELLRNGYFFDLFPDFHDSAAALLQHSIKGEMHEEIHVFKYQDNENSMQQAGFLITSGLFSWVSGNCSRIMCIDVTGHISKKQLILKCLKDMESYLDYLNKQLIQQFNENQLVTREFVTFFYRVYQQLKGIETIQSYFSGQIEVVTEPFDLNGEITNSIEALYLKSSSHNLTFVYTREQAVPKSVRGDRGLHNVALFSIIDFSIQNAIEGTDINLFLQIASADTSELNISYKLTFFTEKTTKDEIEKIIEVRKNSATPKDIDDIHSINKKYGTGLACFDTILLALRGFLVPGNEELDHKKVTIVFYIPFKPTNKVINCERIEISSSVIQDSPLTLKWKPDLGMFHKSESGDFNILKDQVAMVNSRARLPKIQIQNCSNLDIFPEALEKRSYDNSISEADICEGNDAFEKMQDYNICPCPVLKKPILSPVIKYRSSSRIEFGNRKTLIVVDESGDTQSSLSRYQDISENIVWSESNSQGLQLCEDLLNNSQKISAFLFNLNKSYDKDLVKEIKNLESKYNSQVPLCGMSFVPADLNYCKLLDVKNFSNFYLVVKPIAYSQITALIKKLDQVN